MLLVELWKEAVGFILGLSDGDAWLEAADDGKGIAPGLPELHDCGNEEVYFLTGSEDCSEIEAGREDADDGHWAVVNGNGFAEDGWVGGELVLPEEVAQHCCGAAAFEALFFGEIAA